MNYTEKFSMYYKVNCYPVLRQQKVKFQLLADGHFRAVHQKVTV